MSLQTLVSLSSLKYNIKKENVFYCLSTDNESDMERRDQKMTKKYLKRSTQKLSIEVAKYSHTILSTNVC